MNTEGTRSNRKTKPLHYDKCISKEGPFYAMLFKSLVLLLFLLSVTSLPNPQIHIRITSYKLNSQRASISYSWEFSSFSRCVDFCTDHAHVFVYRGAHITRYCVHVCFCERESDRNNVYGFCSSFHGQSSLNSHFNSTVSKRWRCDWMKDNVGDILVFYQNSFRRKYIDDRICFFNFHLPGHAFIHFSLKWIRSTSPFFKYLPFINLDMNKSNVIMILFWIK